MRTPVALFARVSSQAQDFGRQLVDLQRHAEQQQYEVVVTIAEKLSGSRNSRARRPDLDQLLQLARSGRIKKVLVTELSRLGRRARDTRRIVEELLDLGVSVYALNIALETLLPTGKRNSMAALVMTVLMEVDEMETERNRERSTSGQDKAWAAGKQKGRPEGSGKTVDALLAQYPQVRKRLEAGHSVRETALLCQVATGTVQKVRRALYETQGRVG